VSMVEMGGVEPPVQERRYKTSYRLSRRFVDASRPPPAESPDALPLLLAGLLRHEGRCTPGYLSPSPAVRGGLARRGYRVLGGGQGNLLVASYFLPPV